MLKFTKFALINAAISLIPIFPAWTVIPGILLASWVGDLTGNCEAGYEIITWTSIALAVVIVVWYVKGVHQRMEEMSERELKTHFRILSLALYALLNTGILILLVGTRLACNGDGQTFLMFIISGPIASTGLVIVGFIIDLRNSD